MARSRLRAAVVLAVVVTALLAGAAPAFAHTRLLSSDPTDGASLPTPPEQVALTFNENMQPAFSTLTVVGPDGTAYQSGPVTASGGTVSTAVLPLGPAGRYEIGYRVVSDDGHPVSGSVAFTLTTPGPAASSGVPVPPVTSAVAPPPPPPADIAPAAASTDEGGAPAWPWILGAIVLVAGGAVAALRLGRG